jgi:hypothetical protein
MGQNRQEGVPIHVADGETPGKGSVLWLYGWPGSSAALDFLGSAG